MKIAIVNTQVPFIYGGAEFLADSLAEKCREYGYAAEVIKLPFRWHPSQEIVEHMLAARLVRLGNVDQVIALKFPAYYVQHERKCLWLLHQFRQAYDLWGTAYQDIPNTPEGLRIRDAIVQADNVFLREAKRICTNSRVVSERLRKFNNIDSEVLYPPLMDAGRYRCGEFGGYIFYPSRITRGKRQHLAIESMRYVKSGVRLVVAGNPDTREELEYIESIVGRHHLEDRVQVIGRWISQEEKVELFANALGCLYIPYDEDSYGYVTLESYHSRKPVITCRDSGGTLEIVQDGVNGFVVPADAAHLAGAMDRLMEDRARAARLGAAGYETLLSMNISWDTVINRLVQ